MELYFLLICIGGFGACV